jgi:SAM-dependent methyltransferase
VPENRFVGEVARSYDRNIEAMSRADALAATLDLLIELAEGGPVLEFAIGTGRLAVPLSTRGLPVAGIDISDDMLAELRVKPGADVINAVKGDMATTRLDGEFSLVYLVFNTISNLTTQEEQVACFENAARHLRPGGRFLVENGVPDLRRLPPGSRGVTFTLTDDYVGVDEFTDTTHRQQFRSRHLVRLPDGTFSEDWVPFRYVWPSELDLMARIAGLTLEHRWAGWDRSQFGEDSPSALSVWRRPEN